MKARAPGRQPQPPDDGDEGATLRDELARMTRERDALRESELKAQAQALALQSTIEAIHRSRLWRVGHWYWSIRRFLGLGRTPVSTVGGEPAALPQPAPERETGIPASMPALPRRKYDVVALSIVDWDFRFQRPQQLALQFARHGHRVLYLSTSRFLAGDRPWELVAKAERVAELAVRSRNLDIYGGRLEAVDLDGLEAVFADLIEQLTLADVVCLVQIPFWAPLSERLRARVGWRFLYYCMDDWGTFPGIGPEVLALESGLVESADLTVVTAERLQRKHAVGAITPALVRNGVDLEHYAARYGAPIEGTAARDGAVIGYFGALASWVDVDLLCKIAERFPKTRLVLAGGVFDVDLSRLVAFPNVEVLGQRPYDEMPGLLWTFDVCIIPFVVNRITEATNPVKLYEYFFSGKPVVAPRLPELEPYAAICHLAEGHGAFLEAVATALEEPDEAPQRQERRRVARASSWSERYRELGGALEARFPLISVVVVSHDGLELTRACIRSLLAWETWPRLEVLVVDNFSTDGSRDYLASIADDRLRVLLAASNLGFAGANNLALREVQGDVVVLLNNDTVVPPGMLGRLARAVADPRIGLACATTNFCGNEARVAVDYSDLAAMPAFAARRARLHAGEVEDLAVAAMYCVAARREVLLEIGQLDEDFAIGMFEDDDYSLRVTTAGYRVVCVEDAFVHHFGQGSFRKLESTAYDALFERNQALFERKWNRAWTPHVPRSGLAAPLERLTLGAGRSEAWPFNGHHS